MTTINLGKIKPLYKGAYTGGVTYRPLDFTLYFGNLYVCKASSTGNLPTDPAYFDPVASVQAASIPNTPAGSIAATTVQAALNELDTEKVAKTDVIAIAKGGTGATSANAAADAIGAFHRGTLLGTVSQAAGVPTGAVIERGSNANGKYVRFADGTQICTHILSIASVAANGYAILTWTFPASFGGSNPVCPAWIGVPSLSSALAGFTYHQGVTLTTATQVFVNGPTVQSINDVHALAVGRWF